MNNLRDISIYISSQFYTHDVSSVINRFYIFSKIEPRIRFEYTIESGHIHSKELESLVNNNLYIISNKSAFGKNPMKLGVIKKALGQEKSLESAGVKQYNISNLDTWSESLALVLYCIDNDILIGSIVESSEQAIQFIQAYVVLKEAKLVNGDTVDFVGILTDTVKRSIKRDIQSYFEKEAGN